MAHHAAVPSTAPSQVSSVTRPPPNAKNNIIRTSGTVASGPSIGTTVLANAQTAHINAALQASVVASAVCLEHPSKAPRPPQTDELGVAAPLDEFDATTINFNTSASHSKRRDQVNKMLLQWDRYT